MNELIQRIRTSLGSFSPRERWLLVLVGGVAFSIALRALVIGPLEARLERVESEGQSLEAGLMRSESMGREIRQLQLELAPVEARIRPGERTNLFTLLERLGSDAAIAKEQLDLKRKTPSANPRYPESRLDVTLKGATLGQTVQFLYRIESAPVLVIIRSLRIKSRLDDPALLDVSFSASSFTRS